MNGICLIWSRGRHISPSLPVGDDRYLNLSSQKRPTGRNLGENRLVRRSGTASRGTVVLIFCLRMRTFPKAEVTTICPTEMFEGLNTTPCAMTFTCDRSVCLVGIALLIEGLAIPLDMTHLLAQIYLVIYHYFVDLNWE